MQIVNLLHACVIDRIPEGLGNFIELGQNYIVFDAWENFWISAIRIVSSPYD